MASPPAPWAEGLAIDLLLLIIAGLCCQADRASFASVCQRWREAAKLAKPVRSQIPWLLLPSPSSTPSIFSFFSGLRRRIRSLPADFRRERLCGSHPGGWVAVALGPFGGHLLANIFSGARVGLPHRLMQLPSPILRVTPVLIRAVMLSAAPTAAHCVAGALVCGASNVAFCCPGDSHWFAYPEIDGLQDMVYYAGEEEEKRGFYVLEGLGDVQVLSFDIIQVKSAPTVMKYVVRAKSIKYVMPEQAPDTMLSSLPASTCRTGYLVVSRAKLLKVLRYYSRDDQTGARRTLLFRVFEMQISSDHRASWMELDNLDGRVLFVGRGCSRAFEASQLHGFNGGSIYYLDDAEFDVMPCLQNEAEYPSSDMGMYSMRGTTVRPSLDAPSANMRPATYGAKTYLTRFVNGDNGNQQSSVVEMTEDEARRSTGGEIIGTRWSILSEPQSKFSPPIWFCP
ncbi:hypothetical protein SETIT_5G183000v2 [Setaria italica]|uniref:KIB1-4 beta-propeller domain-containing protein n=1 Tax=Setaria italica TaxID=4555 RepID=K3XSZ0_SETIT|nr:uncharacterized protein LOC101762739 [Setaria italica]RCV25659.1 hypothetical protein SETIT_5G183000v2 [Setaria italica]